VADVEMAAEMLAPFALLGTVMATRPEQEPDPLPWHRRLFGRRAVR